MQDENAFHLAAVLGEPPLVQRGPEGKGERGGCERVSATVPKRL